MTACSSTPKRKPSSPRDRRRSCGTSANIPRCGPSCAGSGQWKSTTLGATAMAIGKSTAVGGFVLGALALGAIAILLFAGQSLFTKKLLVVAYFQDSVAGLVV